MKLKAVKLKDKTIWSPFTIPSGIITVSADIMQRIAEEVNIGLITTKSVGVSPYGGYPEPVFSQYSKDSLSTAIGLSHPGYREWIEEIKEIYPLQNKFLLASIFGSTLEDFVTLAKAIHPYCNGLELNFCCPHSLKYGAVLAKQEEITIEITRAVHNVILEETVLAVKLTPDGPDIGHWSQQLVKAGADAITAIGPTQAITVKDPHTGKAILSYGSGGLSGPAILARGIECIRAIRKHVDVPIIAGGGIKSAKDVLAYQEAGGNIFSIGTCLAGMDTPALTRYFNLLLKDVEETANNAESLTLNSWILNYKPAKIIRIERQADLAVLYFDLDIDAEPGQFIFAWLPDVGEKPFSIASAKPLMLGIRSVGKVSMALCNLKPGDEVMIKGPFGKPFALFDKAVLVAGGTGAVPLRFLVEKLKDPYILLGAKTQQELLFVEDFKKLGKFIVATEDGSEGYQGNVCDILSKLIQTGDCKDYTFYNCGPDACLTAASRCEVEVTSAKKIFLCVERHTACGVGLCGKCALDGYRSCVDGPIFTLANLPQNSALGKWRRSPSGKKEFIGCSL